MNFFYMKSDKRLLEWRKIKKNFQNQKDLNEILKFWSNAPIVKRTIDPWDISQWPSVWELIENNNWCEYNLAIMLETSIRICLNKNPTILLVKNTDNLKLIVECDKKYALLQYNEWVEDLQDYEIINVVRYNETTKKYTCN